VWARDLTSTVAAASTPWGGHEVRNNLASAADVTNKRHKSALERQHCSVKSHATKQADQAPLHFFLANARDESLLWSKAFRGERSAKQAAEHIQRCMSTAFHNTGTRQQQQQQQEVVPETFGLPQLTS
jgi:hypothetical protein